MDLCANCGQPDGIAILRPHRPAQDGREFVATLTEIGGRVLPRPITVTSSGLYVVGENEDRVPILTRTPIPVG